MKLAHAAQLTFVVLAATAVYGFVRTGIDSERRRLCTPLCAMRPDYAARNRLAPDFELQSLRGPKVRLSDYRGQVIILNFWTKHCKPCLQELPSLVQLGFALSGREEIALLTISTDESRSDVEATLKSVVGSAPPFVVLIDPDAEVVTGKYGTKLFPETWFIDPSGTIRARFDGARNWAEALPVGLAESLLDPSSCPLEFRRGLPLGGLAQLCE